MEEEATFPCIRKSSTARFRKQMFSEHQHNLDVITVSKGLLTKPINEHSVHGADWQHRPLCLKQVIRELQQDFILEHKLGRRPSKNDYATSGSLPNISDLRLTEVALRHANAYKEKSQLLEQCDLSSSFESTLNEKLNGSRRKWRLYTEQAKYKKKWHSLGRDVQDHRQHDNRKRDRDKVLGSGQTSRSSGREREQPTAAKHKDNPNENRCIQFSKQRKSPRYRFTSEVLPRIILPD